MTSVSSNINRYWPKDALGRSIQAGDTVAVPKLYHGVAKLVICKVEKIEKNCVFLSRYGKYLHSCRLAIVDWEDLDGESS